MGNRHPAEGGDERTLVGGLDRRPRRTDRETGHQRQVVGAVDRGRDCGGAGFHTRRLAALHDGDQRIVEALDRCRGGIGGLRGCGGRYGKRDQRDRDEETHTNSQKK